MNRRNIFRALLAGAGSAFALGRAGAQEKPATKINPLKVAYHLSEIDKVNFVLGNIRNHIEGVGGPDKIEIVLVVHGPALRAFRKSAADPRVSRRLETFSKAGVKFDVCGNTMRGMKLEIDDLLPGFAVVKQGGVVRLAELQGQGYAYLRP